MLIVDSLIISGVKFVLTRLAEAVSAEMYDETSLREELLAAQMKLELGEISDEDFAKVEEEILSGLREIRARRDEASAAAADPRARTAAAVLEEGASRTRFAVESIEANVDHDEQADD